MLVYNGNQDSVTIKIINLIKNGQYQVGDRLPTEREMVKVLGVSRSSLRESLKGLKSLGVLQSRQGSGIYLSVVPSVMVSSVLVIQREKIMEMLQIREALEMKAFDLIPDSKLPELAKKLEAELAYLETRPQNTEEFKNHDIRFHGLIRAASENELLCSICNDVTNVFFDDRNILMKDAKMFKRSLDEHLLIYQGIAEGDREKAKTSAKTHVENTYKLMKISNNFPDR